MTSGSLNKRCIAGSSERLQQAPGVLTSAATKVSRGRWRRLWAQDAGLEGMLINRHLGPCAIGVVEQGIVNVCGFSRGAGAGGA